MVTNKNETTMKLEQDLARERKLSVRKDAFLKRSILNLIRFSKLPPDKSLQEAFDKFKTAIQNNLSPDDIERALETFKNAIIKAEMDNSERSTKSAYGQTAKERFSSVRSPENNQDIKDTYLSVLSSMELDLGDDFLQELL